MSPPSRNGATADSRSAFHWLKLVFVRLGVLPFLLIVALVTFTLAPEGGLPVA